MDRTSSDREVWSKVLSSVRRAARSLPKPRRRPVFPDWLIVAMYLWSVWHDRTLSWACERDHYGRLFRPRGKLPSVSRFARRVQSPRCRQVLRLVHADLSEMHLASPVSYLDGKPLTVSPVSKDRDARRGHVSGGFAKGYKLHAWATEDGRIPLWAVTGLNTGECPVAEGLCAMLPPLPPEAVVLADTNLDDRDLHKRVNAKGGVMVTPLKGGKKHPPEQGRHEVTLRQMGAGRRALVEAWAKAPALLEHVMDWRDDVERIFSALTCAAGGLGPLPAWVRGTDRVSHWVGGKIILYHARLQVRKATAEPAVA